MKSFILVTLVCSLIGCAAETNFPPAEGPQPLPCSALAEERQIDKDHLIRYLPCDEPGYRPVCPAFPIEDSNESEQVFCSIDSSLTKYYVILRDYNGAYLEECPVRPICVPVFQTQNDALETEPFDNNMQ